MSMRTYPIEAYGLLAFPEDLQAWWDRETEGYGTPEFERQEVDVGDVSERLPDGFATCVYGDSNSMCNEAIKRLGSGELYFSVLPDFDETDRDFVILELGNYPSLFKAAYKSKADAIEELKRTYARVLPEDFDFANRFFSKRKVYL